MDMEPWLNVAGPAVIGALALLDSHPRYRSLARALTGLPLVIAIVVAKALVIGVDLQTSAPYAAAALMAPLLMFVAVGHLVAHYGATSTMLVGWCVYGASAFGLIKVARDLPLGPCKSRSNLAGA